MPLRSNTAIQQESSRLENQAAASRETRLAEKQKHHRELVAGLMSAMEGKPMKVVADLAGDFGLSELEAFEAVDEVGDGFAPEPSAPNANEASEDAPKH